MCSFEDSSNFVVRLLYFVRKKNKFFDVWEGDKYISSYEHGSKPKTMKFDLF